MTAIATGGLLEDMLNEVRFGADGLIAAVAQQHDTGEILMLAWMNREALAETLRTGNACYWSRSRQSLWRKGESSGQVQRVKAVELDCDGDAVILRIEQTGVACHTGRRSCFWRTAGAKGWAENSPVVTDPEALYGKNHAEKSP